MKREGREREERGERREREKPFFDELNEKKDQLFFVNILLLLVLGRPI